MVKIIKVLGKPGTGKTTYLANKIIEKTNKGYSFDDIVFTTYSRTASRAMYNKLFEEIGVKRKELSNFGTIYRLANRTLGLHDDNYIKLKDFVLFSGRHGIEFDKSEMTVKKIEEIDEFGLVAEGIGYVEGNLLFTWWQVLKCLFVTDNKIKNAMRKYFFLNNKQQNELSHRHINQIMDFYDLWEKYKQESEKYEYQDMLQELFLKQIPYMPFKFMFIDETHDFGLLQMSLLSFWYSQEDVEQVYICYDPMQTIYKFTGSNPDIVDNIHADKNIILKKSYRVPEIPWGVATRMARSINDNSMSGVSSSGKQGDILYVDSIRNLFLNEFLYTNEPTFFLLRKNQEVKELMYLLERQRIPVRGLGRTKTIWEGKDFRNIYNLLVRLEKNLPLNKYEVKSLIMRLPVKGILKRGVKEDFRKSSFKLWDSNANSKLIDDQLSLFFGIFEKDIGSIHDIKEIISYPKVNLNNKKKEYLRQVTSKDMLAEKVTRWLGTYHSSKGLEAKNVVLFDYYLRDNWDVIDETRLAYVGVTRTTDKVFLKGIFENDGFIEQFI